MLAVAVGANLAVFGLIDRAILTPARHVVRPDRLFTLAFAVPGDAGRGAGMTTTRYVAFDTIREHVPALVQVAAWRRTSTTAIVAGEQTRVESMLVSGSYFELLGAVPRLGRRDPAADDQASGSTAVISHAFWRSAFGGDPARARAPHRRSTGSTTSCPASCPPASAAIPRREWMSGCRWPPRCATRRDGISTRFETSSASLRASSVAQDVAAAAQASAALDRRVSLVSLDGGEVAPAERRIAYALAGVSILVLIIGLANAATLLLVRGTRRQREAAIRTALGATRGRLFGQVLLEAVDPGGDCRRPGRWRSRPGWATSSGACCSPASIENEVFTLRTMRRRASQRASARSRSRPQSEWRSCRDTSAPAICRAPVTARAEAARIRCSCWCRRRCRWC